MNKKGLSTRQLTSLALLTAISFILGFIETTLPLIPNFSKIDISALPVLIGSFAYGPISGLIITLAKNLLRLPFSETAGVGQLADFLIVGSFAFTAGLVYKYKKSRAGALLGCLLGTISIAIVGALANKYLLIPFFSKTTPIEKIIELYARVNSLIVDVNTYILYAAIPFNLFKGIVISLITILIYKKISILLKGRNN